MATHLNWFSSLLSCGVAITIGVAPRIMAQSTWEEFNASNRGEIPFILPPLRYHLNSLEPHIGEVCLKNHHERIHSGYVLELNKGIGEARQLYLELKYGGHFADNTGEVLATNLAPFRAKLKTYSKDTIISDRTWHAIGDSVQAHYNHSLFWQMMTPKGGGAPTGELAAAISNAFGSFTTFKEQFTKAAIGQRTNGWVWLTLDGPKLKIEALPGEQSPLSLGRPVLLGIDLWDHAYRPQYGKEKGEYVAAWFNVINWNFVAERYARYARLKPNPTLSEER